MPIGRESQTPEIQRDYLAFGSVRVDPQNLFKLPPQMPSLYFMDGNSRFTRLRPFHEDGFAIFQRDIVRIIPHIGEGDPQYSFTGNVMRGRVRSVFPPHSQPTQASDLDTLLTTMHDWNPMGTNEFIITKDEVIPHDSLYITDGVLNGMTFYRAERTDKFRPVKIFDEDFESKHFGHTMISKDAVIDFYDQHHQGILEQLLKLGVREQHFVVARNGNDDDLSVIHAKHQYYPKTMISDTGEQLRVIREMIMQFR